MKTISILAAGAFPRKDYPLFLLRSSDIVVCCDGALATALRHGITPDIVIGDLDSVSPATLGKYTGTVVKVDDQECNDLTKAFRHVMSHCHDVDTIHILGATGKSEAHTVGNMSLLMQYETDYDLSARGIALDMVSDFSTIFAIGDSTELHIGKGRRISLFSPDQSLSIHSEGLCWSLDNVVFDNWWKATLNIASDDIVNLRFNHPAPCLIVLD